MDPAPQESSPSDGLAGVCEIEKWRAGVDVTPENLLSKLAGLNAPVIINGALDEQWSQALEQWQNWSYFLEAFGTARVPKHALVNKTLDIAQDGPNSNTGDVGTTLGTFLLDMKHRRTEKAGARPGPFLFQRVEFQHSLIANFSTDLAGSEHKSVYEGKVAMTMPCEKENVFPFTPPLLRSLCFKQHVVSIGGSGGGLPPHKHTSSWLGVIVGKKRWWFFPPGELAPERLGAKIQNGEIVFGAEGAEVGGGRESDNSGVSLYARAALNKPSKYPKWLHKQLREKGVMMECTQKAGEIVFVPNFFWHSTENMGDVVAIGSQADGFDEPPNLLLSKPRSFCALSKRRSCHDHNVEDLACYRRAWELEPFSIKHILGYSNAMLHEIVSSTSFKKIRDLWRGLLSFLVTCGKDIVHQAAHSRLNVQDATQIVGRIGMWMDTTPKRVLHLLASSSQVKSEEFVAKWQSDKRARKYYTRANKVLRDLYTMKPQEWAKRIGNAASKRSRSKKAMTEL